jgi:ABC-type lipoprotein release transport system permease subunit
MAAVALSRLLDGQLFGLSPLDPVSYALVLVVLSLAAGLATWAPALRAARVDPASSLRCD